MIDKLIPPTAKSFVIQAIALSLTFLSVPANALTVPAASSGASANCQSLFLSLNTESAIRELDSQVETVFEETTDLKGFNKELTTLKIDDADGTTKNNSAKDSAPLSKARTTIDENYQRSLALVQGDSKPVLSIVIPAYNEAKRLPQSLKQIREFFDRYPFPVEVLVVVEKSKDQTVELARDVVGTDSRFQVIDNEVQKGKGYAVRSGMKRATGKYVLFMDADLSTPLPEIYNFLQIYKDGDGPDLLIGSREKSNGEVEDKSLARQIMSKVFRGVVGFVGMSGVSDTQCGFKMFKQEASTQIFSHQQLNGFAFDVEVLVLANELGYKTQPMTVEWTDAPNSKVNPILDPVRMLWDMLKIRKMVRDSLKAKA